MDTPARRGISRLWCRTKCRRRSASIWLGRSLMGHVWAQCFVMTLWWPCDTRLCRRRDFPVEIDLSSVAINGLRDISGCFDVMQGATNAYV